MLKENYWEILELSGVGPVERVRYLEDIFLKENTGTLALSALSASLLPQSKQFLPPYAQATHLYAADHRIKHQKIEVRCTLLFQVTTGILLQ